MTDYRQYVSFDLPQWAIEAGVNPEQTALSEENRRVVEKAFEEIASTPEGEQLLREAASRYPDGKIHVAQNTGGWTLQIHPGMIALGTEDSRLQYSSPETGQNHDLTIQNLVVHELYHIVNHHEERRGDENKNGISLIEEAEAVRATNAYMKKYYDEPFRDEDTTKGSLSGSFGWDWNRNFQPQGHACANPEPESLRQQIAGLTADEVEKLGPEIQSLYEFRNNQARFNTQLAELKAHGSIGVVVGTLSSHVPSDQAATGNEAAGMQASQTAHLNHQNRSAIPGFG
ncbi:MAG: hypothetical protein IPK78_00755 [Rhodospirillales bacterium]|nr:hypothetical protein [Rhodospirillales bacterium]